MNVTTCFLHGHLRTSVTKLTSHTMGKPAYRSKHPSCNLPTIPSVMISATITCERQPRTPLLTCMASNNTSAFVFRDTPYCALPILHFLPNHDACGGGDGQ